MAVKLIQFGLNYFVTSSWRVWEHARTKTRASYALRLGPKPQMLDSGASVGPTFLVPGRSETGSPLHDKDSAVIVADNIGAVSPQILTLMPAVICDKACAACIRLGFLPTGIEGFTPQLYKPINWIAL